MSTKQNITNYPFYTNPWTLLIDCENIRYGVVNASQRLCILSTIDGILCAYILPIITICNFILNGITVIIFLYAYPRKTRQIIYLGFLSISDIINCISVSVISLLPSKGLPYATNGQIYFIPTASTIEICKFFKTITGFAPCFKTNMLITTMLDRVFSIFTPIKYGKLSAKYAWFCVLITFLVSLALTMPMPIYSEFVERIGTLICWPTGDMRAWGMYSVFVLESCLLQLLINAFLSLVLLGKVYFWIRQRRLIVNQNGDEGTAQLSACAILLSVSCIIFVLTIPTGLSFCVPQSLQYEETRIFESIRDIFMVIGQLQVLFTTTVYWFRMETYRRLFICILKCKDYRKELKS
ncbi:hypothetical protein MN116_004782 [Schistosoma mekongi]|uniref:G-protein coupled receptors family 1 profile domain-containing protein n=1 Tax=Schistosoma mekongi TaxID=38744 RepID=A0AAE1ZCL8_SCHME|nr:hypothetical protein MN116_004782 [Schistosoma mekongi]